MRFLTFLTYGFLASSICAEDLNLYWTQQSYAESKLILKAAMNGNKEWAVFVTSSPASLSYATPASLASATDPTVISDWCTPCVNTFQEVLKLLSNHSIPTVVVNYPSGSVLTPRRKEIHGDLPFLEWLPDVPRLYILKGSEAKTVFFGDVAKDPEKKQRLRDYWAKLPTNRITISKEDIAKVEPPPPEFEMTESVTKSLEQENDVKARKLGEAMLWNDVNYESAKKVRNAAIRDPNQTWFLIVALPNRDGAVYTTMDAISAIKQKSLAPPISSALLSYPGEVLGAYIDGKALRLYEAMPYPVVIANLYTPGGERVAQVDKDYPFLNQLVTDIESLPVIVVLRGTKVKHRFLVPESWNYSHYDGIYWFPEYWAKHHKDGKDPVVRAKAGMAPPVNGIPQPEFMKD